ncbi:unnamed protein product [Bursaphelenchus xylophilus]|uniref:PRA1 family protein n=1 Tax=Bursaphelenchus xylophilus TaxID=6326 RepID=A0A1I7S5A5_BURXY|nr:unnamed protein product [Bursaphelenchus xylophilus]CAG9117870.1 unnamed protein product [Bursaphelenchus xylophilus]
MADESNFVISENLQFAPLRSLDEFLLDKARFQLPTFNDLKKWNNRIVTNLLYYQSNYFVFLAITLVLGSFIHAQDVMTGVAALGLLGFIGLFSVAKTPSAVNFRQEHPYVVLASLLTVGFFNIYVLPAIVVLLFIVLVPLLLVFVHASIRLRNFGSKWNYAVEKLQFRRTLMSQILDAINLDVKSE